MLEPNHVRTLQNGRSILFGRIVRRKEPGAQNREMNAGEYQESES